MAVGVIVGWLGGALVGLLIHHIEYHVIHKRIFLNDTLFASVPCALSGAVTVFWAERSGRHQWRNYISAAWWSTVCNYVCALVIGFVVAILSYCVGYLGLAERFTVPAFGAPAAAALGVAGFIWSLCMFVALFLALGAAALPFALSGSIVGALGAGLLCRLADWPKAQ
jgi:Na+-driven multidrug efflux pump